MRSSLRIPLILKGRVRILPHDMMKRGATATAVAPQKKVKMRVMSENAHNLVDGMPVRETTLGDKVIYRVFLKTGKPTYRSSYINYFGIFIF
mgnify:CR=1 FL=1